MSGTPSPDGGAPCGACAFDNYEGRTTPLMWRAFSTLVAAALLASCAGSAQREADFTRPSAPSVAPSVVSGVGNGAPYIALGDGAYACSFSWSGNGSASDAGGAGRHALLRLHSAGGSTMLHGRGPSGLDVEVVRQSGGRYLAEADIGDQSARWSLSCRPL